MQALIDALGRLPGVGPKGAQRIAFHLLKSDSVDVERRAHFGERCSPAIPDQNRPLSPAVRVVPLIIVLCMRSFLPR